jgi:transcriptional regulator with XRE-family HTH domain
VAVSKIIIDLEVGQRIKTLREKNKAVGNRPSTIRDLSKLAMVSVATMQGIERGRIHADAAMLNRIATALNVPASALQIKKSSYKLDDTEPKIGTIRNKRQVLFYSKLIIYSLEDALSSIDGRHHNNPPSDLIIEDESYIAELRALVVELKRLNELLEAKKPPGRAAAKKPIVEVKKHLNTFLSKWAATVGVGAGVMTVGAMAALLHQLGASDIIFEQLSKRLPIH